MRNYQKFSKLVENINIDNNIAKSDISDPIFNVFKKYENHPSVKILKRSKVLVYF